MIVSERGRAQFLRTASSPSNPVRPVSVEASNESTARLSDAVYVPSENDARLVPAQISRGSMTRRGGNSRAFEDPMTLEQTFPGLRDAPGGSIIAVANSIFDLTGPAREATAQLTLNWSNTLINQIAAIDPAYRFDSLGFPETLQGQINQLNRLRFDRAAAFMRVKGELRPL
ncbi:hypothetical protein M0208_16625 [Sphingomonas sp. SUN019]|uniref:hypothetical protein n=1 Tax=Sphingomonas sp. SUN019 TaxID=2937788 RepID=UPI0021645AF0|nr:hypothetical protein [Sphingomonas sp. SUN019]UVO52056.1 hypothetical protein M0208_16625 [Sphingomonas sp. SUN019]